MAITWRNVGVNQSAANALLRTSQSSLKQGQASINAAFDGAAKNEQDQQDEVLGALQLQMAQAGDQGDLNQILQGASGLGGKQAQELAKTGIARGDTFERVDRAQQDLQSIIGQRNFNMGDTARNTDQSIQYQNGQQSISAQELMLRRETQSATAANNTNRTLNDGRRVGIAQGQLGVSQYNAETGRYSAEQGASNEERRNAISSAKVALDANTKRDTAKAKSDTYQLALQKEIYKAQKEERINKVANSPAYQSANAKQQARMIATVSTTVGELVSASKLGKADKKKFTDSKVLKQSRDRYTGDNGLDTEDIGLVDSFVAEAAKRKIDPNVVASYIDDNIAYSDKASVFGNANLSSKLSANKIDWEAVRASGAARGILNKPEAATGKDADTITNVLGR